MKTILAIETCSEICSVALFNANNQQLTSEVIHTPRQHSKLLLPTCEKLLQQANLSVRQIDLIGITQGPGSFTGVRIGAGVAKGLSYSLDIPITPVSTLLTVAMQAMRQQITGLVHVVMDARMGEVYAASYFIETNPNQPSIIKPIDNEKLIAIDKLDLSEGVVIGNAIPEYQNHISKQNICTADIYNPLAEDIIYLVQQHEITKTVGITPVTASEFSPVYLRNKVVD